MNEMIFNSPKMLYLLMIIPAMAALYIHSWLKQRKAVLEFDSTGERLTLSKSITHSVLMTVATLLIIIGSAGPAWDPQPKMLNREGRDLVFLLDVSKSMLADDLLPTRLQNSKQAIIDCVETLKNDRVGLVLFAGSSAIKCPLTSDYKFFRLMLEDADWSSVDTGGTRIGDAVLKTMEKVFHVGSKASQDIILITDGDDHDKHSLEAVKKLGEQGISLIIIGVGDARLGSRITIEESGRRSFMMSGESEVWSKMNPRKLQQLVDASNDGVFLDVQTKSYALGKIYNRIIKHKRSRLMSDTDITVYTDKYQYFIGLAVLLLFIRTMIFNTKKRSNKAVAILALTTLFNSQSFNAYAQGAEQELQLEMKGTPSEIYNQGCKAYGKQKYDEATLYFEHSAYTTGDNALKLKSLYNTGNSQYRHAQQLLPTSTAEANALIQQAVSSFVALRALSPKNIKVAYNLEAARVSAMAIQHKLKEEQNEENPLQKKVQEAMDILTQLIEHQSALLNHTTALMCEVGTTKPAQTDEQSKLKVDTQQFNKSLKEIEAIIPKIPAELTDPLSTDGATIQESPQSDMTPIIKHIDTAVVAQSKAINHLEQRALDPGSKEQAIALEELKACMEALQKIFASQQNDPQESEGDESESEEYDDSVEYDESDSEGDMSDSSSAQGEFEADLNSREIPPPTDDPMDILAEEMENNSMRMKKTPTKYTKVKKDW